jgi:hypothetical protein
MQGHPERTRAAGLDFGGAPAFRRRTGRAAPVPTDGGGGPVRPASRPLDPPKISHFRLRRSGPTPRWQSVHEKIARRMSLGVGTVVRVFQSQESEPERFQKALT